MNLPLLPQDKANHFVYGCLIGLAALLLSTPLIALAIVVGIAFTKEIHDKFGSGSVELADFLYTVAGGVVPIVSTFNNPFKPGILYAFFV